MTLFPYFDSFEILSGRDRRGEVRKASDRTRPFSFQAGWNPLPRGREHRIKITSIEVCSGRLHKKNKNVNLHASNDTHLQSLPPVSIWVQQWQDLRAKGIDVAFST